MDEKASTLPRSDILHANKLSILSSQSIKYTEEIEQYDILIVEMCNDKVPFREQMKERSTLRSSYIVVGDENKTELIKSLEEIRKRS